jgi:hypothetical protein
MRPPGTVASLIGVQVFSHKEWKKRLSFLKYMNTNTKFPKRNKVNLQKLTLKK